MSTDEQDKAVRDRVTLTLTKEGSAIVVNWDLYPDGKILMQNNNPTNLGALFLNIHRVLSMSIPGYEGAFDAEMESDHD